MSNKKYMIDKHTTAARNASYWRLTGEIEKAQRCEQELEQHYKQFPQWEDELYSAQEDGGDQGAFDWRFELGMRKAKYANNAQMVR
jgi:hypothetical protein